MEPVTMIMAGSAIAGGVSSIMGGFGKNAEMEAQIKQQQEQVKQQNQQALNNWVQGNIQKAFNNGREQFNAANQWVQQMKRNQAIDKAAYEYQWDAKQALKFSAENQHKQLSNSLFQQQGSLLNALAARGIGTSSGMYASMALAQAMDAVTNASIVNYNVKTEMANIDKETRRMQGQKTANVFIGNMQQWDQMPLLSTAPTSSGSAGMWAIAGGLLSGAAQIGGAMGGMGMFGGGGGGGGDGAYADGSGPGPGSFGK
jgi:hypothetical protein